MRTTTKMDSFQRFAFAGMIVVVVLTWLLGTHLMLMDVSRVLGLLAYGTVAFIIWTLIVIHRRGYRW